jgi:xanthine dehydrogenase small subunit
MRHSIRYVHRGEVKTLAGFHPQETLLDHLRLRLKAVGTKEGCNEGDCGACTIVLGRIRQGELVYEAVNACILLTGMIDGAELITVEDLAEGEALHPVQEAMVAHHASQCGFCTPGIVMSLFALHEGATRPVNRRTVTDQLAGNLCRCTGYRPIIDAAFDACHEPPSEAWRARRARAAALLATLPAGEDLVVPAAGGFFAAPASLESLSDLYLAHPDATLVAGATDVGLWVTKQLRDLGKIIWLGRVEHLDGFVETEDALSIGATVTHARAMPWLRAIDPDLGEVMRRFGSCQVRSSGTVGGNLANGSPIGDLAPAFIALGAKLYLRRGAEGRAVPLEDFFLAYGRQDRRPSEFVLGVAVRKLAEGEVFRCFKVSKRFDEDISAVMGAFKLSIEERVVTGARVAFGGMAGTPRRAPRTEAALAGAHLDDGASWSSALEALAVDYQPLSDLRASASYRLEAARALLHTALVEVAGARTAETRLAGLREIDHAQ